MGELRILSQDELETVAGGNAIVDGAACFGGLIAIFGTEGLALLGLGVATAGACYGLALEVVAGTESDTIYGSSSSDTLIG